MRVDHEVYKGIEFVRISNLPAEQREKIKASLPKEKIIKILKDEMVISDCVQYSDYLRWFNEFDKSRQAKPAPSSSLVPNLTSELKLSLD
jgi:hypothetical protein